MLHYTVTAHYQDAEIGYGEGMDDHYAVEDCINSIDDIYKCSPSEIILTVRYSTGDIVYITDLMQYEIDTGIM